MGFGNPSASASPPGDGDTTIVERAAAILDRELEASPMGDLSAPPVNDPPSPSQAGDSWMRALEMFAEALRGRVASGWDRAVSRAQEAEPGPRSPTAPGPRGAVIHLTGRARASDVAEVTIALANDDRDQPAEIAFSWTALLAELGRCISEERITIEPPDLSVPAGEIGEVVMRVDLPPDATPGAYVGLVRTNQPGDSLAIVTIYVD